jgi:NAD(P)-dependent dehydrogenase (short-subunit alcohol dehydrogenase family)
VTASSGSGRLAGKVGIISGAAGGIGSAAARAFAGEGAHVGLLDLPGPGLDKIAAELAAAGTALACDVTSEPQVKRALTDWTAEHDRADFVYVCAGRQLHGEDGPAAEVDLTTWQATIAANLTGAFLVVKHSIAALARARAGSLIVCGSPTGITMSANGYTAYAASKAGMMALARSVATDYVAEGIRANVVVPGTTVTPLIEAMLDDPVTRASLMAGTPIGRLGTPADLTGIAVFLASDESAFATGATFCIDGGLTQR